LDAWALVLPIGMMAVWYACRSAGCGLGAVVMDLNDHPVWAAGFLPDIVRDVQPRYELQMLGVFLGTAILMVSGGMTLARILEGRRIWITLILLALAMLLLNDWRVESTVHFADGVRLDQTFNLL